LGQPMRICIVFFVLFQFCFSNTGRAYTDEGADSGGTLTESGIDKENIGVLIPKKWYVDDNLVYCRGAFNGYIHKSKNTELSDGAYSVVIYSYRHNRYKMHSESTTGKENNSYH